MTRKGLIKRSCYLDTLDAGDLERGMHVLFFLQIQYCAYN